MADDTLKYNAPARSLHWIIAFLILGLLVMGFFMGGFAYGPFKIQAYNLHKAFGITVLCLAVVRLLWRTVSKAPKSLSAHKNWEKFLSKTIHAVLYGAMIAMPLSGWVMTSAGDFPASFFGLFDLPKIAPKDKNLFATSRDVHELLAFIIIGCVGLHIAGALKHHFIDRDTTLNRMGGHVILGAAGLMLLAFASYVPVKHFMHDLVADQHHVIDAPKAIDVNQVSNAESESIVSQDDPAEGHWVIDPQESRIQFSYQQYGSVVQGAFTGFDADIVFDLEDMADNHVSVEIDAGSVETGSADRDEQARSPLWFAASEFPRITFEAERFRVVDNTLKTDMDDDSSDQQLSYEVDGMLTIRDVTVPVSFPFTLDVRNGGESVVMQAHVTLSRLDFGVGQGVWQSTDAVADAVEVALHVEAQRF